MSLWKIFSGPTPEKLARQAQSLVDDGQWGPAKVALERALEKAQDAELKDHLRVEIRACCDQLARGHLEQAVELVEGGHQRDAAEYYRLAMEVARDPQLETRAREGLDGLQSDRRKAASATPSDVSSAVYDPVAPDDADPYGSGDEDDQATFWALIGTLPEDMQDAYEDYGESFRSGYLALNSGEFDTAAHLLEEAHRDHPQAGTYIPLELAAAYTHTGRLVEARELLDNFLHYHPDILPAYQLYCDLLWEAEAFDAVNDLLAGVPADLVDSVALVLLKGENFQRAGRHEAAIAFLEDVQKRYGWSEPVARLLATVYTDSDQSEPARLLYGELIQRCQSCHSRVDPLIKHNFAELSFAAGQRDSRLLELYLSLAQEAPEQAAVYFQRVSSIYTEQGYEEEAARFQELARQAENR